MSRFNEQHLKELGFTGLLSLHGLTRGAAPTPSIPGVYVCGHALIAHAFVSGPKRRRPFQAK